MLHRSKSRLVAAAAAAARSVRLPRRALPWQGRRPPWSKHNPAVPSAFTNTTPALSAIDVNGLQGTFLAWKGQFDNKVKYKIRINGKWHGTKVIPGANTNTSPSAALFATNKGREAVFVAWKPRQRRPEHDQVLGRRGRQQRLNQLDQAEVVVPGGKYFRDLGFAGRAVPRQRDELRASSSPTAAPATTCGYEIGTESGPNGRRFTWGSKTVKSAWISGGTKTEPTTTSAQPALTEIIGAGGNGTVYVFWKGRRQRQADQLRHHAGQRGTGLGGGKTPDLDAARPACPNAQLRPRGPAASAQRPRQRSAAARLQGPGRRSTSGTRSSARRLERAALVRQRQTTRPRPSARRWSTARWPTSRRPAAAGSSCTTTWADLQPPVKRYRPGRPAVAGARALRAVRIRPGVPGGRRGPGPLGREQWHSRPRPGMISRPPAQGARRARGAGRWQRRRRYSRCARLPAVAGSGGRVTARPDPARGHARPEGRGLGARMDARALETLLAVTLVAALAPVIVAALPGPKIPAGRRADPGRDPDRPAGLGPGRHRAASSCWPTSAWASCSCWPATSSTRGCSGSDPGGWPWSAGRSARCSPSRPSACWRTLHLVRDFVPIGLALTTTALGTLLPILHDNDMLAGQVRPVHPGRGRGRRAVPDRRDLAVPDQAEPVRRARVAAGRRRRRAAADRRPPGSSASAG